MAWIFFKEGLGVYSNARLQAFSSRWAEYLSASFSKSHAGFIPLLLHLVAAEDGVDSTFRAAANLTGPADKPFPVPLHIFLVVRRHVLLNGAVLVESSVQPWMGTDPAPIVEHLYGGSGQTHIHFLADILKGNRVVHPFHGNMVVGANGSLFPAGKLEWIGRQRSQERLFLHKETGSASVFLLEGFVVECFKALPYRFVQFQQGQELPIPQSRQNKSGDDTNRSFHSCHILWHSAPGRNKGSGIVFR